MSAFIVSETHIDALVTYAVDRKVSFYFAHVRTEITAHNAEEIGRVLINENVRSVNHRYRENKSMAYRFKRFNTPLTAVEAIKACHCLDYQSCETDDWESTKAFSVLRAIEASAMRSLPGYEKAPWGIDSDKGLTHAGTVRIRLVC